MMKVGVVGLWHLGSTTAACLASAGHSVIAYDDDQKILGDLQKGKAPLFEPGLDDLIQNGISKGKLKFISDPSLFSEVEVLWVTFDTPVDEKDHADTEFVEKRVRSLFQYLADHAVVIISSQLPVGSTRRLWKQFQEQFPKKSVAFACSPENLRLGKAIEVFTQPDRVVMGVDSEAAKGKVTQLLEPITSKIEWMTIESAEMTKHALNAFLATSVTFINELATLCEKVGADASQVERGLKTEVRIGPKAYLKPGSAFAGGTLARDVSFLVQIGKQQKLPTELFNSILTSNEAHKNWYLRRVTEILGSLKGRSIAVLGLTYKPGTSTLRRSTAVEFVNSLLKQGAKVSAFDPAVKEVEAGVELQGPLHLCASAGEALEGAEVAVVCTEWPEFKSIEATTFTQAMKRPVVLDPSQFLVRTLGSDPRIQYFAVGKGEKK